MATLCCECVRWFVVSWRPRWSQSLSIMPAQPFNKIVRSFQWLHLLSISGLSLALLLAVALYWGGQRIVEQEREKVGLSFFALTTFLDSQARFLEQLRSLISQGGLQWQASVPVSVHQISRPNDAQVLYKVQARLADVPYTISCYPLGALYCPTMTSLVQSQTPLLPLGDFLTDAYTQHWAESYFPGARTVVLDAGGDFSLIVPTLDTSTPQGLEHATMGMRVIDELHDFLTRQEGLSESRRTVYWRALEGIPDGLAAITQLPAISGSRGELVWPTDSIYAATVATVERTQIFQNILDKPIYDEFWLLHDYGGLMLGKGTVPGTGQPGVSFERSGLIFTLNSADRNWRGVFRVSYSTLFQANLWLPGTALALLVLFILGISIYVRWYNRRILLPAELSQQALIESESFNRILLDTAPVALCVFTPGQGELVFCNSLAREWLNLEETNQVLPLDILPGEVFRAHEPGVFNSLEINGRYLQAVYAPTRYKQQAVVLCVLADISDRIAYEEVLSQAKAEADSANAAKTRFLAAVSHEVRTPLYGILGTLELMLLGPLQTGQRSHLRRLQYSANSLMQLISDILDVTKIEANQLVISHQAFNPRRLLLSCVDAYAAAAARKKLLLFACVDTNVPAQVVGDPERIRQVLNNFVSNALKFTQSGQIIVRLRSRPSHSGEVLLSFQVSDTGIGIPKDEQTHLFTPFYQVENSGLMAQGTGLGLSICSNLVALMQGEILVTSEPGLGSSFTLELSLAVPEEGPKVAVAPQLQGLQIVVRSPHVELSVNLSQWFTVWGAQAVVWEDNKTLKDMPNTAIFVDALAVQAAPPNDWLGPYVMTGVYAQIEQGAAIVIESANPYDIAQGLLTLVRGDGQASVGAYQKNYSPLGLHLLVAEDNPINQATLGDQLAQFGCTVRMVDDGQEALSYWQLERFDAILTDVNMPNMNGYELAQAIRVQDANIPILGVTANATRTEEQRCKEAGMSAWLVKPIDLDTLYVNLEHWCKPVKSLSSVTTEAVEPLIEPVIKDSKQAIEELNLVPERHRNLYRESMNADAQAILQAAGQGDELALRRALHRLLGALLAMKQSVFAARVQQAQTALHAHDIQLATRQATELAQDLQQLIATHLPS